ncbi:MAG TPA: hypothetical protein VL201_03475, partial [Patescibacteria group bacterium]|nr:hypothetical protein [Patescibacteria group bacterium]
MNNQYIIFFLLIGNLQSAENKNFLLKFFTKKQLSNQEINWKEEANYFNTKVIQSINTVIKTYQNKMAQEALSTVDIKAFESILTYIDIGNQNFLKPKNSSKYSPLKEKMNRLRSKLYEYMYFNRNTDHRKVLKALHNSIFTLNEDELTTLSSIDYANPYVFKSIDTQQTQDKEQLNKKIKELKVHSEEMSKKSLKKYDQQIELLNKKIKDLEKSLEALESNEPTLISSIKEQDASEDLLSEIATKEAEKNEQEKALTILKTSISQIDQLLKLITEAINLNAAIIEARDAWIKFFGPTPEELRAKQEEIIKEFATQSQPLTEHFRLHKQSQLLLNAEDSGVPTFNQDNLRNIKSVWESKQIESKSTARDLANKIKLLSNNLNNLQKKMTEAAQQTQIKNQEFFEKAKEKYTNDIKKITLQIQTKQNKIKKIKEEQLALSETGKTQLQNEIEKLEKSFSEAKFDILIKDVSKTFYTNIETIANIIEPWFTNLDKAAIEIKIIDQLPKIEWCYTPFSLNIPFGEKPKESIIKSIKTWLATKSPSSVPESESTYPCYLILSDDYLKNFKRYYEMTFIVVNSVLDKIRDMKDNIQSSNHQTIFNKIIIKQLLYKIRLMINTLCSNYQTFYEKNKTLLTEEHSSFDSFKKNIDNLNNNIDRLIKTISIEASDINDKTDAEDKNILKNSMEELIFLLERAMINTGIDYKKDIQIKEINSFVTLKNHFFNELTKLQKCMIMIGFFIKFQYNWYSQEREVVKKFNTLRNNAVERLNIILSKLDSGIREIINAETKKIQNNIPTGWNEKIELHTSLLHDLYEYITIYEICIIPIIKNELFYNKKTIENVTEAINDTSSRIDTILKTFTNNSMGYIFKPKY